MARNKQSDGPTRYVAVRDVALPDRTVPAGETLELDPETASLLLRDGMIREE